MDQSKKRKRSAEEGDGRGAIPLHATVKVKHIAQDEALLGPIVAVTPGITAPEDITFHPYRIKTINKKTGRQRQQIILQSSQHGRLDYLAQEEAAGGPASSLKHYVAVFDPEAGKVTVTECHKVTLRSTLRPTQEELDEEATAREMQTYTSQRIDLGQEFGTKKAKKVIADQTVNAINQRPVGATAPPVDAAQQAQLERLNIKTEDMLTGAEAQQEADGAKPRPVPDMKTTNREEVYPLENLVSAENLELLRVQDWQQAAMKGENVKFKMRYVARRMARVALMNKKDMTKLKLLKYVDIALTWFMALESNRGGNKLPQRDKLREKVDAPGPLFETLRKQFCDGSMMSKYHIDKFILYLCAVVLHIDNFEPEITDLQEDLRLSPQEMGKYFMELGCRIKGLTAEQKAQLKGKGDSSHRIAKLEIPLEFPKPRVKRAKR